MLKSFFVRSFFITSLFFGCQTLFAQDPSLKYEEQIAPDSLRQFVYTLSSDSLEGRETGKPGQKKATSFLVSKYRSWGLLPIGNYHSPVTDPKDDRSFLQKHSISVKNNMGRNLTVKGKFFLYGKDFIYPPPSADSLLYIDRFTFIGIGNKDLAKPFYNNVLLSKKFIRMNIICISPSSTNTDSLIQLLATNNPSSLFIVTGPDKIESYFTKGFNQSSNHSFPIIYITEEVAEYLFPVNKYQKCIQKINRSGKTTIKNQDCPVALGLVHDPQELCGENVIAFIKGSDTSGETVIISSHYDHLGKIDSLIMHGADDNASGTSTVLELARIFTKAKNEGHGPKRNILFLNVTGEEKGLFGSAWYVNHPAIPLENTIVDLNIDMVGRTDHIHDSTGVSKYVYIIGAGKISSELSAINEERNKMGSNLILDYKYDSNDDPNHFYSRSDHYNFVKKGIPVIFYFDGIHEDYHRSTDIADKINFELLATRARLVFLTAWELANRKERITIDKK